MKRVLFSGLLLIGFSSFAFSQTAEKDRKQIKINICQPSITEAGRQSSFQFSYIYLVITNEEGSIKKVTELLDHKKFKHLMNDEKVIPCIKNWRLKPSERYIVKIDVGTTSTERSLSILSKTVKIKLIL